MEMTNKDARSRAWVMTLNNYTDEDEANVKALGETATYAIVGKEVGEQGTPHLQGYMYFPAQRSWSVVNKKVPRCFWAPAKGTAAQNKIYCGKQECWFLHGEPPIQGKRTDIERVREQLLDGANMADVVMTATSNQSTRYAETFLKYHERKRDFKPEVRWFVGPTGSGKTKAAHEWLGPDLYVCLENAKYWEGYDAHEHVLIDDFRKSWCKFSTLLRILDRYQYRVEVKGASRQLLATKIAITCPYHPSEVYDTREDVQQLIRRIDEIIIL